MLELFFVVIAAVVAWNVGRMVAESVWRHWLIASLALVLAGLAAASHMAVNGFSLAVIVVALAAGLLGKRRARHDVFLLLRAEELLREEHAQTNPRAVEWPLYNKKESK